MNRVIESFQRFLNLDLSEASDLVEACS
jgi:hypothetical protein